MIEALELSTNQGLECRTSARFNCLLEGLGPGSLLEDGSFTNTSGVSSEISSGNRSKKKMTRTGSALMGRQDTTLHTGDTV